MRKEFIFHNCKQSRKDDEALNAIQIFEDGTIRMDNGIYGDGYKITYCPYCGKDLT